MGNSFTIFLLPVGSVLLHRNELVSGSILSVLSGPSSVTATSSGRYSTSRVRQSILGLKDVIPSRKAL